MVLALEKVQKKHSFDEKQQQQLDGRYRSFGRKEKD